MKTTQNFCGNRAIVLGASLGGLLTARVLSMYFEAVILVERDAVVDEPTARKGQPQTRHLHGLLATGLTTMTHYFPDLPHALAESGAVMPDFAEGMSWYTYGGVRKRFTMGVKATTMSRPLLESLIRARVLALPNVTLLDQCAVKELMTTPDHQRVTGVMVERRGTDLQAEGRSLPRDVSKPRDSVGQSDSSTVAQPTALLADLVVDCTGRGSRTPQWLTAMGYAAPPVSEVKVDVGYATRLYRRDPADLHGQEWMICTPDAPRETRFGALFPVEGDRWICSIGGWHGDHGPADEDAFLGFARSLPHPDIPAIIAKAEPISDIVLHKFPHSLRRHYEKLRRFPSGYLVLGDAISSFNPTYGQGMTSAALQVAELDKLLAGSVALSALAPRFFKAAAKVIDIPWQLAVGEDFRYPATTGPKPAGIGLINRYVARVHRATLYDEVVCHAFLKVMNLMEPPTSLFAPAIVWRVVRSRASRQSTPLTSVVELSRTPS